MDWITINPVIVSVFTGIAVDQVLTPGAVDDVNNPAFVAEWKDRKRQFINPIYNQALYLKVTTVQGIGWDESRLAMLDTGVRAGGNANGIYNLFETRCGLRKFNLQVQSWCLEDDDTISSSQTIERIRTGLGFDRIIQQLLDVNVDITDSGTSRDMAANWDKRRWSISSIDVTMTAAVNDTDTVPLGYIGQILLTSHAQAAAGTDLPIPPNVVDEAIPDVPV